MPAPPTRVLCWIQWGPYAAPRPDLLLFLTDSVNQFLIDKIAFYSYSLRVLCYKFALH